MKMINVEQARYLTAHRGEKATSLRQWQQLLVQYEAEQQAERADDYDQRTAPTEAGDDQGSHVEVGSDAESR